MTRFTPAQIANFEATLNNINRILNFQLRSDLPQRYSSRTEERLDAEIASIRNLGLNVECNLGMYRVFEAV